ncbi:MAG: hypothetical protein ACREB7_01470 [Sphingopyxis sp.]|uniref:hypothetical protein n=1 Tax=Sphingopyxis sp. TaxID=1908224 RepID=UPI003D6D7F2F
MTRAPRFIGYGFMVGAAALAVAMREGHVTEVGPLPAVAVALFLGMVGVMLVFTDLMVRGLYAQVDVAKRAAPPTDPDGGPGAD